MPSVKFLKDLQAEKYRAVGRVVCLLDQFSAAFLDAAAGELERISRRASSPQRRPKRRRPRTPIVEA